MPALVVPGWEEGECREEAQDTLDRGDALEIQNIELAQYVLAGYPI